ncbi:MAG: 16S rRNA (cytosine(967)-C(5))-methyltransferase RsmB, partial [Candidatus Eremiobacteraeota bacterium]|nr:16S rRNA (cytosine(967)-C(5))-methyltransferase RsmB [Candidatus Eremiobacteraeota bacterium]
MTAREVALAVVRDVFPPADAHATERSAQEALDYRLRRADLGEQDRGFATELAYGAIRMRRTLDWYLEPFIGSRDKPLPAAIQEILRLAFYELLYMRAQEHATTNEWVNLAKKYGHRGVAGLTNAVLRSFLRERPAPPNPDAFADRDDFLGAKYSFPTWLVRQWRSLFGDARIDEILEATNRPAQTAIVVNVARTSRDAVAEALRKRGIESRPSQYAEDALLVDNASAVRAAEREAGGDWWIQSESSAMVADVLNAQPGETIVDACSGRGSKALQAGARLAGDGTLICIEKDARKAEQLSQRAAEAGITPATIVGDATTTELPDKADRILIDAPCSATGVTGRHPEARWRKKPDDGARLSGVQWQLLDALLPALHDGGALVYAVCSVDPRETSEVIERAL